MSPIRAILFDLGNTLLYFNGDWEQVFAEADEQLSRQLVHHGLDLATDEFKKVFRRRLNDYYMQRETDFIELTTGHVLAATLDEFGYQKVPNSVQKKALEELYRVSQAHWKAEDEAPTVLSQLKEAGYDLGIISNAGDDADVQTLVDESGLRSYFDFVLSSASCGIRKPDARIFEIALGHWGMRSENAAMVGDTLGADILGAKNAGLTSVWITRRAELPSNRDHADTIHPDATIANLTELPPLFNRTNP